MALFLTLLYILTIYLTVPTLFFGLTDFHVETIIAFLAILASVPSLAASRILSSQQFLALIGLSGAVVVSIAVSGWLGGAVLAFYGFAPVLFGFILVAINCKTKLHLQLVFLTLFLGSAYYIVQGAIALRANIDPSPFIYNQGELRRIQGLGFVNDPNDFSQVLVTLLPCQFLFWKKESPFWNAFAVWLPCIFLLVGLYFSHSRGAIVALAAIIVVAARRRIGGLGATAFGVLMLLAGLASGWSGGRDVTVEAGSDRIDAWYTGIQLIKTHPLFGVGIGHFTDFYYITAHNSVVVCAAEIGTVGVIFWIMFVFSTLRNGYLLGEKQPSANLTEDLLDPSNPVLVTNRPSPIAQPVYAAAPARIERPAVAAFKVSYPAPELNLGYTAINPYLPPPATPEIESTEIKRLARVLLISIIGFLVSGWFLSRALSVWLFIFGGMMFAVVRMAEDRKIAPPKIKSMSLMAWSIGLSGILLVLVSLIVRFSTLMEH